MLHPKKQSLSYREAEQAVGDGAAPTGTPAAQLPQRGGAPYPHPPADYNLTQIIILIYNLQKAPSA